MGDARSLFNQAFEALLTQSEQDRAAIEKVKNDVQSLFDNLTLETQEKLKNVDSAIQEVINNKLNAVHEKLKELEAALNAFARRTNGSIEKHIQGLEKHENKLVEIEKELGIFVIKETDKETENAQKETTLSKIRAEITKLREEKAQDRISISQINETIKNIGAIAIKHKS